MMVPFRRKKSNKQFPVKVCTFDSELEFHLEHRATGRYLFELICRTIGLRETWYFGLQFEDSKGNLSWLKMDKKVQDQSVHMTNGSCMFIFLAKFFPENVAEELVQEVTQHLFFLQIKQAILSMDVYCPPEASVLLASYAVQAKYGDYDEAVCKPGMLISENLLPQRVIDQYQMTPQMWEERIKTWYADHRGMSRDEAEMEYLKIAQDLDMFGVNYFPITNKKNTEVWLGVTALGLNIYNKENKLLPVTTFQWNEILHISFDDRKFVVKTNDSKSPKPVIFYSQKLRINKLILDLCVGNHDLYMKRRKPDTMEIQQMKAQAKEEKQRRQVERNKLTREKQLREAAEREKAAMEQRLMQLQEEMRAANEALHRSEEAAELLAEKNRLAEEEAMLLSHKAQEVEQEINRMRMTARKTEEEKMYLERKTQEAELLTARMMEESRKRALEADKLKNELIHARVAEKEAKEKLLNFLSRTSTESILITPSSSPESPMHEMHSYDLLADGDMEQLSLEIEKERVEYLAKSKQVQNQLKELRSEIEQLKIGENQCPLDDINAEQLRLGSRKNR
ncbi:moesin/ezrin/radixin homolog 2 isoform X3 [Anopheles arabiensis]|uniref:moesin/ezrin/radixin homolog 2 isoform X3 n=1 Tax=Anopheles arabiensis TaxID=7173 RepID=UPI001AAD89C8|nr:moesin/ezrin/radixin homolog 2 isoform X3 [Anopheles arabiensis]XP_041782659.1 moesin/ezrin/radixin homolog 2-like isoform X3 [Anopheles merus]XP_041787265.1 moesin/ezrin/radixin homolog 2-like isoform X3 [Anopheles merus]